MIKDKNWRKQSVTVLVSSDQSQASIQVTWSVSTNQRMASRNIGQSDARSNFPLVLPPTFPLVWHRDWFRKHWLKENLSHFPLYAAPEKGCACLARSWWLSSGLWSQQTSVITRHPGQVRWWSGSGFVMIRHQVIFMISHLISSALLGCPEKCLDHWRYRLDIKFKQYGNVDKQYAYLHETWMSFIWWLLGSKGDLNWYFIKCALCLCVIEWQWWGWAVGHDLIMLNSSQVTQVCTPHISDIQTLSTQNITHNLDLGRYIKKQETTSDTRLILLHSRTYKIQGYFWRWWACPHCVGLGLSFASSHFKS